MSHGSKTHVLEESSAKYRHMYISLGYNTKFFFFPCLPTSSFPSPSCESLQIETLLYISGNLLISIRQEIMKLSDICQGVHCLRLGINQD